MWCWVDENYDDDDDDDDHDDNDDNDIIDAGEKDSMMTYKQR